MTVLIVTFTYPPARSVNGFRPRHFAKAMVEKGWEVRVLTRHFTGKENSAEDYRKPLNTAFSISEEEGVHVYRTPFKNSWFTYYENVFLRRTGLWKVVYLIQLFAGRTCQESYNSYFRKYLSLVLKTKKPDIILVESGPTNLVRLVSQRAVKYGIPYAIDFRDLYYHEMYRDFSGLAWNKKIKIRLEEWYMRKAIRDASKIVSLNTTWLEILKVPVGKRLVVSNGFDGFAWDHTVPRKDLGHFTISVVGTIYARPFLDIFLNALDRFLRLKNQRVRVRFVAPGRQETIQKIRRVLPYPEVELEEIQWPYEKAISLMAASDVLMYHGWPGYRQLVSAKIYDYIRSGARILIIPADQNGLDDLVRQTGSGISCTTAEDGAAQLEAWYRDWESGNLNQKKVSGEGLVRFSREFQANILVNALNEMER